MGGHIDTLRRGISRLFLVSKFYPVIGAAATGSVVCQDSNAPHPRPLSPDSEQVRRARGDRIWRVRLDERDNIRDTLVTALPSPQ